MNISKSIDKKYSLRDKRSFEKLYWANWKKLCGICNSKINNIEASEEIVQDIFVSLWKRKDKLQIDTSIENYLVKAVKFKVIDYYRKKNTLVSKNINVINLEKIDQNIKNYNDVIYNFLQKDLQCIVNQLPNQRQQVYRLSREEQLKTNEISLKLQISENTVKSHLVKALSHIRKEIKTLL